MSEADERKLEVKRAMAEHLSLIGLSTVVEVEDMYLLNDAIRCYIGGADAGTIFCAHAVCERDIAAEVSHSASPPERSARWGLGNWMRYCEDNHLLHAELINCLDQLNEQRKSLYHYGRSQEPTALQARAATWAEEAGAWSAFAARYGFDPSVKEVWQFSLDEVLRRDALSALVTAFRLRTFLSAH